MWQPNNEYKPKHSWEPCEDKTLTICWGMTDIHEIAEAFMCSPYNIITRAKVLGLIPSGARLMSAKDLENMTQLFDSGHSIEYVSNMYNLPDEIYRYSVVPAGVDQKVNRELQEYYAKHNENQLDMFGNDAGESDAE